MEIFEYKKDNTAIEKYFALLSEGYRPGPRQSNFGLSRSWAQPESIKTSELDLKQVVRAETRDGTECLRVHFVPRVADIGTKSEYDVTFAFVFANSISVRDINIEFTIFDGAMRIIAHHPTNGVTESVWLAADQDSRDALLSLIDDKCCSIRSLARLDGYKIMLVGRGPRTGRIITSRGTKNCLSIPEWDTSIDLEF